MGTRFVDFAIPMLIQSSVLILILLFADLLLRKKIRAVFRYWIWMIVLLKLVLPTSLSSPISLGRWFGDELAYVDVTEAPPEPEMNIAPPAPSPVPSTTSLPPTEPDVAIPVISPPIPPIQETTSQVAEPKIEPAEIEPIAPTSPSTPTPATSLSWQGILFFLWMVVVIVLGLLLLQRAVFVRSLIAQAKEADDPMIQLLKNCCKHMKIRKEVGLKVSPNATSPAVCGLFRPVILVPDNLASGLDLSQLHIVLFHELAHIKRYDLWVNLAQTLLQILYFYNPLLWLANAIIRRAREQAVDETVLVAIGEKAEQYPQTLVEVAKLAFEGPALSLRLIGVMESKSALSGRIKRILTRPIPKTAKLGIIGLLVIGITATILIPMAKSEWSDENLLIRFGDCRPPGPIKKIGPGGEATWSTSCNVEFKEGEDLLVVAELYQAGKPMRVLGRKIFQGPAVPDKLSVHLTRVYENEAKTVLVHSAKVQLGDQILDIPEFTVKADRFYYGEGWGRYGASGLRKERYNRTGQDYARLESLFYWFNGSGGDPKEGQVLFWIPGHRTKQTPSHHHIQFSMVPLSRLKYLIGGFYTAAGRQGLDGETIPEDLSYEQAKAMADQYFTKLTMSLPELTAHKYNKVGDPIHGARTMERMGPLDIRFVGVRPDNSDDILDAKGKKIGEMNLSLRFSNNWRDDILRRDFIFEMPTINEPVLFLNGRSIKPAGETTDLWSNSFVPSYPERVAGRSYMILNTDIPRTYRASFAGLFNRNRRVRKVDVTLEYFHGPRRKTTFCFTGPFKTGQTFSADNKPKYKLAVIDKKEFTPHGLPSLVFRLTCPDRIAPDSPILFYDKTGDRHLAVLKRFKTNVNGTTIELYPLRTPLGLSDIQAIAAEEPCEFTVKDVLVDYPQRPARSYAEDLDMIARRLNLTGLSSEQLAQYKFRTPGQAIEVVDIIKSGWHVQQAYKTIRYAKPKINLTSLDQATQDKIRRTATTWANIDALEKYGIQLGLMGKWPEFFDMALTRFGQEKAYGYYPYNEQTCRQDDGNIANTMVNYRMSHLTEEQVQELKKLILKTDNGPVLRYLFWYLEQMRSQATTDALWELAQNETPLIWWQAVDAWYSHTSRTPSVYDDLPEKMKLRLILVERNVRDENLRTKALALLPGILTPEMAKMASSAWYKACETITREFDKVDATKVFVTYLRQMQTEMTARQWTRDNAFKGQAQSTVARVIITLNVWYKINLGNLGENERADTSVRFMRTYAQFQTLITEAIQWYEGNENRTPVELPFVGKVVNTDGEPIAGSELSFTMTQEYKNERGDRSQREVSIGQCRTGADGGFSFDVVEGGEHFLFNITAEGYVQRNELFIQRLIDGRYRYQEVSTPENNIIILQRPGKISGIAFDVDGQPLANAELELIAVNDYSHGVGAKKITTDSEGKFTVGDISEGRFLLRYTVLRMKRNGPGFREEYGGRCGAVRLRTEEGGNLTGVVLDLSKSVCTLELEVVDDAGEPVKEISFILDAQMGESPIKYASVFSVRRTSNDGLYRFEGMPPGDWRVRLSSTQRRYKKLDISLIPEKTARYKVVCEPLPLWPTAFRTPSTTGNKNGNTKPGGQHEVDLRVSIMLEKTAFDLDEPIPVTWRIENKTNEDKTIIWHEHHYSPVLFEIGKKGGKKNIHDNILRADEGSILRPPEKIVLKPGDVKEATFDLRHFGLAQQFGVYEVTGLYSPKDSRILADKFLKKSEFKDVFTSRIDSATIEVTLTDNLDWLKKELSTGLFHNRLRAARRLAPIIGNQDVLTELKKMYPAENTREMVWLVDHMAQFGDESHVTDVLDMYEAGGYAPYWNDYGDDMLVFLLKWGGDIGINHLFKYLSTHRETVKGTAEDSHKRSFLRALIKDFDFKPNESSLPLLVLALDEKTDQGSVTLESGENIKLRWCDSAALSIQKMLKRNWNFKLELSVPERDEIINQMRRQLAVHIPSIPKVESPVRFKTIDFPHGGGPSQGLKLAVKPVKAYLRSDEDIALEFYMHNERDPHKLFCIYQDTDWRWTSWKMHDHTGPWLEMPQRKHSPTLRPLSKKDFIVIPPGKTIYWQQTIRNEWLPDGGLPAGRYHLIISLNTEGKMNSIIPGYEEFCRKNHLKPWSGTPETGPIQLEIISENESDAQVGLKGKAGTICRSPNELMDRFLELARQGDPAAGELFAENVAPDVTRLLLWSGGLAYCEEMAREYQQMRAELLAGLNEERKQFYRNMKIWTDLNEEVTQVGARAYCRLLKSNKSRKSWIRTLLMSKGENEVWRIVGLINHDSGVSSLTDRDYLNPSSPAFHPAWGETIEYRIRADDLAKGCYIDFDNRKLHRMTPGHRFTKETFARLGIDGKCGSHEVSGNGGLIGIDLEARIGHSIWGFITPLNVQLSSSLWQGFGYGGGGFLIKTREGGIGVMIVSGDVDNYFIRFKMLNSTYLSSTYTLLKAVQSDPTETAKYFLTGGLCRHGTLDVSRFARRPDLIRKVKSNYKFFGPERLDTVYANSTHALAITSKSRREDYTRLALRLSKEGERWLVSDVQIEAKEDEGNALRDFLKTHPDARVVQADLAINMIIQRKGTGQKAGQGQRENMTGSKAQTLTYNNLFDVARASNYKVGPECSIITE